jgi:DNA-binding XRE family transcriptional regulator
MPSSDFHDLAVGLAQLIAGDADKPPDPTIVLLIEHAMQAAYEDGAFDTAAFGGVAVTGTSSHDPLVCQTGRRTRSPIRATAQRGAPAPAQFEIRSRQRRRVFNQALYQRVRELRTRAGLTQAQAAAALGIDPRTYVHFEKRSPLPAYLILPFADLVGVDLRSLLAVEERD